MNGFTGTTLISSGTLVLTNINALASSPLVDNGVLDISTAFNPLSSIVVVATPSLAGSGQVLLGNNALNLTSAADTFSGSITGAGGLTISAGTETLTGANSYTGTTSISGTLLLVGSGTLSSSTMVADSGVFDISGVSGSATAGSLSGSGTVALGANTLVLGNGKSDFSGIISGTGGLTVSGGTQILSGTNTYGGGTNIVAGTLQLGDGKTGGSILGNVSDAGTLAFDYAATATAVFSGVISGAGGVSQTGAGITVLTGQNTYAGGTLISTGTLQLGNGGTSGAITGNVLVNGTLAFDRSNAVTFGGVHFGIRRGQSTGLRNAAAERQQQLYGRDHDCGRLDPGDRTAGFDREIQPCHR